jgi:hypothetical protein
MNARIEKKVAWNLARNTPRDRCDPGKVLNPGTDRCIRVGSNTYRELVNTLAQSQSPARTHSPARSPARYGSAQHPVQGPAFYYIPGGTVDGIPSARDPRTAQNAQTIEMLKRKLLERQIQTGKGVLSNMHRLAKPLTSDERTLLNAIKNKNAQKMKLTASEMNILRRYRHQEAQYRWRWLDPRQWHVKVDVRDKLENKNQQYRNILDTANKLESNLNEKRKKELEEIQEKLTACELEERKKNKNIKNTKIELEMLQQQLDRYKTLSSSSFPWVKELDDQDEVIRTLRARIKNLHAQLNGTAPISGLGAVGVGGGGLGLGGGGFVRSPLGPIVYQFLSNVNTYPKNKNKSTLIGHYQTLINGATVRNQAEKLKAKELVRKYATMVPLHELEAKNRIIQQLENQMRQYPK